MGRNYNGQMNLSQLETILLKNDPHLATALRRHSSDLPLEAWWPRGFGGDPQGIPPEVQQEAGHEYQSGILPLSDSATGSILVFAH